jgi:hypothetical protein
MNEIFKRLAAPFHPDLVQWKAQTAVNDKGKALAVAYLDARDIMDRLDEVLGPVNWQANYEIQDNTVMCSIHFRNLGSEEKEWLHRHGMCGMDEDAGGEGGTATVAFKRAVVQLGVGRYLYKVKGNWVDAEKRGKNTYLKGTPKLPAAMLPEGFSYGKRPDQKSEPEKVDPTPTKVKLAPAKAKAKAKETDGRDRAKAYVVPTGLDLPFEGETLGEVMSDEALGEGVIKFLAGVAPSPAGRTFEPATDDQEKLKAAALFLAKDEGWL